jgi:hypothetical protein
MAFPVPQSPVVWVPKSTSVQFVAGNPIVPVAGAPVGAGRVFIPAYTAYVKDFWCYEDPADPLVAAGGATAVNVGGQATAQGGASATSYATVLTSTLSIAALNLGRVLAAVSAEPEFFVCSDDGLARGSRTINIFCDAGSVTGTLKCFWLELRLQWP